MPELLPSAWGMIKVLSVTFVPDPCGKTLVNILGLWTCTKETCQVSCRNLMVATSLNRTQWDSFRKKLFAMILLVLGMGVGAILWSIIAHFSPQVLTPKIAFQAHGDLITCIAISPDSELLASGSKDNTAKIWNIKTGRLLCSLGSQTGPVTALAFSPDSTLLAIGTENHFLRIWRISTGKLEKVIDVKSLVRGVGFAADGSKVISAGQDGVITWWDLRKDHQISAFKVRDAVNIVNGVSLVSIEQRGAVMGVSDTFHWHIVDLENEKVLFSNRDVSQGFTCLAFSPDRKMVATGDTHWEVQLWDTSTGLVTDILKDHGYPVSFVAFSHDGKQLVSVAWGGYSTLISTHPEGLIWNLETKSITAVLRGPKTGFSVVEFAPDDNTLVTGDYHGNISIWELKK